MGLHIAEKYLSSYGEFVVKLDSRIDDLNEKTTNWSCYNESVNKENMEMKIAHILNYLYDLNHIIEVPDDILSEVSELNAFVGDHGDQNIPKYI
jgi:hypothetical protein